VKVVRGPWLGRVDWIPFGKVFGPVGCFLFRVVAGWECSLSKSNLSGTSSHVLGIDFFFDVFFTTFFPKNPIESAGIHELLPRRYPANC